MNIKYFRDLLKEATNGPWRVSHNSTSIKAGDSRDRCDVVTNGYAVGSADVIEQWLSNAELIVELRNSMSDILDYIQVQQNVIEAIKNALPGCSCDYVQHDLCSIPNCSCDESLCVGCRLMKALKTLELKEKEMNELF